MRKTLLIMMAMLQISYAGREHFEQGKKMAQSSNATFKEKPDFKNFKAESYSKTPINSIAAQAFYEKSDAEIKSAGVNAMVKDKNVKPMQKHHENRKPLNPVDNPTLDRMKYIMAHSKEISHGQSTDKYRCSQAQANCVTKMVEHTCHSGQSNQLNCAHVPAVKIYTTDNYVPATISLNTNNFKIGSNRLARGYMGVAGDITSISIYIGKSRNMSEPCGAVFKSYINGEYIGMTKVMCDYHARSDVSINLSGFRVKYAPDSSFTFTLEGQGSGLGGARPFGGKATIMVNHPVYHTEITWSNTCNPIYLNQCTKIKEVCVEAKGQRMFGTQAVTLDCWNYQKTYQCGNANINTCDQYQSCNFIQKKCSQKIGEYCVQHQETYQCTEEHCDSNQMLCGQPTGMCLSGNCQSDDPENNNGKDFAPAVSALAGLFAAGQDLKDQQQDKEGSFTVFKGKATDCGRAGLGIYNCCADNGGVVKNCSDSEKVLYNARKKGFATHVGEYCAKRVLGACVLWHEGWCVFESKLSRIINEQGRGQLGIGFGDAEHPNCQGLTPEMLQQIKFDQVDFREVFADIASTKAFPNTQKLNESIASTAKATLQKSKSHV